MADAKDAEEEEVKGHGHGHGHGHSHHHEERAHQGYCFVYASETPQYKLSVDGNRLVATEKPDFKPENFLCCKRIAGVDLFEKERTRDNLLWKLNRRNIQYTIRPTPDLKWILVLVTMELQDAETWMDERDVDVPIHPVHAVRVGRRVPQNRFVLAARTKLPEDEDETYQEGNARYTMLPLEMWDNLHLPYESGVDQSIYAMNGHGGNSVIDDRLFLRTLFDVITEDKRLGGCGFNITKFLAEPFHPMKGIIGINDLHGNTLKKKVPNWKALLWTSMKQNRRLVYDIRDYYGELVAFYFAFLVYYQWCLFFAAPIAIWFIIQLAMGKIDVPGSSFVVLYMMVWSAWMTEGWHRLENHLRFKWGMMNYAERESPRPGFKGDLKISEANGAIIEDQSSEFWYKFKLVFSMSTIAFCIGVVVSVVVGIWTLQQTYETVGDRVWIGIVNATQIQIFNYTYVYLARFLNELENHRLQEEYYNHLVIKRIFFFIVNSFNSLIYLAFIKGGFDSKQDRLNAVRIQLVTTFLFAIFAQNAMELGIPKLMEMYRDYQDEKVMAEATTSPLVQGDQFQEAHTPSAGERMILDGRTQEEMDLEHKLRHQDSMPDRVGQELIPDPRMWQDAMDQLNKGPSPPVLDNTAEIVLQYGYIMLFVVVFPLMPVLAIVNNYIEFRLDLYGFINARRPVPLAASGLGVWKSVLVAFSTVAVVTNMAIVTWNTNMVKHGPWYVDDRKKRVVFFFLSCGVLLLAQLLVRKFTNNFMRKTREALGRQELAEKYLLYGALKSAARKAKKKEDSKYNTNARLPSSMFESSADVYG